MIGRIIETRSIFISFFNSSEQPIKKDKISSNITQIIKTIFNDTFCGAVPKNVPIMPASLFFIIN